MIFSSGCGWLFILALLPSGMDFLDALEQAFRTDPYGGAERQFLLHGWSFGVWAGPESSEASVMWHGLAGIDLMHRAVAGRTSCRRHCVGVMQNVAGIAKYAFRSQAIIVLPVLAQILMRRMAEQSNFGSRKTSRGIEDPRLRSNHQIRPFGHRERRAQFPYARPREIARRRHALHELAFGIAYADHQNIGIPGSKFRQHQMEVGIHLVVARASERPEHDEFIRIFGSEPRSADFLLLAEKQFSPWLFLLVASEFQMLVVVVGILGLAARHVQGVVQDAGLIEFGMVFSDFRGPFVDVFVGDQQSIFSGSGKVHKLIVGLGDFQPVVFQVVALVLDVILDLHDAFIHVGTMLQDFRSRWRAVERDVIAFFLELPEDGRGLNDIANGAVPDDEGTFSTGPQAATKFLISSGE